MDDLDTKLAEILTDNFFGTTDGLNPTRVTTIKNLILKLFEGYELKQPPLSLE